MAPDCLVHGLISETSGMDEEGIGEETCLDYHYVTRWQLLLESEVKQDFVTVHARPKSAARCLLNER